MEYRYTSQKRAFLAMNILIVDHNFEHMFVLRFTLISLKMFHFLCVIIVIFIAQVIYSLFRFMCFTRALRV